MGFVSDRDKFENGGFRALDFLSFGQGQAQYFLAEEPVRRLAQDSSQPLQVARLE